VLVLNIIRFYKIFSEVKRRRIILHLSKFSETYSTFEFSQVSNVCRPLKCRGKPNDTAARNFTNMNSKGKYTEGQGRSYCKLTDV